MTKNRLYHKNQQNTKKVRNVYKCTLVLNYMCTLLLQSTIRLSSCMIDFIMVVTFWCNQAIWKVVTVGAHCWGNIFQESGRKVSMYCAVTWLSQLSCVALLSNKRTQANQYITHCNQKWQWEKNINKYFVHQRWLSMEDHLHPPVHSSTCHQKQTWQHYNVIVVVDISLVWLKDDY